MSSGERGVRVGRRWIRALALALPVGLVGGLLAASPAAAAEVYPRPSDGTWTVVGHGNGHGHGMSQYGALGGARAGKTWQQILAFYYPGTTLGSIGDPTIRVRVASLGSAIQAYAANGLSVTWDLVNSSVLPTTRGGQTVARWRLVPAPKVSGTKTKFRLEYQLQGSTSWSLHATASVPLTGAFLNRTSGTVTSMRSGSKVVYRGQVRGTLIGSAGGESLVPVVALPMESYLRTVVPGEVPSSWPTATLAAQAAAARSFAEYHRRYAPLNQTFYDVYDDTRSQVFKPTSVDGVSNEAASTNSAISVTARTAVLFQGAPAFTQFSASSGGWTSTGGKPYLVAQRDDWDAVAGNPYHTWTATVSVSTLEGRYPAIGRLTQLAINSRNGLGDQGGRVVSATLTGTTGAVDVTGEDLRSSLGIGRSDWFQPQLEATPAYPRDVTGDGRLDVLAIDARTGGLVVYPTNGKGAWGTPVEQESGVWSRYAKALTAGPFDEDSISDVLVQDSNGSLLLRRGLGDGTFAPAVKAGSGWQVFDLVTPVGDFDGDGLNDLLARRASDGALFLYAGNGRAGFKGAKRIGSGWHIFNLVLGAGDFSGDGRLDVLARTANGDLWLYRGNGAGGWGTATMVGGGWDQVTAVTALGDFTGDGKADVIGRRSTGELRVYPGNGSGGFLSSRSIGGGWNVFSALLP